MGSLIEIYWYPLYAFARREGQSDDDAKDLTQGFFTHLLSGKVLTAVSPEKGRFSAFLLVAFKNFMANQRRAAHAIRRGGLQVTLPISDANFRVRYDRELIDDVTPERLYERSCVEALLQRVRLRLEQDYREAGKFDLFQLLEPHLTHRGDAIPRAAIGQQLKLSTAAVAMSIHRMRRRYGELLRQEVAATVTDPADVEEELSYLMSVVSEG